MDERLLLRDHWDIAFAAAREILAHVDVQAAPRWAREMGKAGRNR